MMTYSNYTYHGEYFVVYVIMEALYCTPETKVYYMSTILQLKKIKHIDTETGLMATKGPE